MYLPIKTMVTFPCSQFTMRPEKVGPKKGRRLPIVIENTSFFVGIVGKWKCFAQFLFGCCPLGETRPSQYIIFHSDHQDCGILDRLA